MAIIGGRSCRSCEHRRLTGRETFCYRYPPCVVVVPMPDGRGGMAAGFQSVYPQVDPNMPCGEYARSEVNAKTEIEHAADGATRQ
jgi:hypothetical protein